MSDEFVDINENELIYPSYFEVVIHSWEKTKPATSEKHWDSYIIESITKVWANAFVLVNFIFYFILKENVKFQCGIKRKIKFKDIFIQLLILKLITNKHFNNKNK